MEGGAGNSKSSSFAGLFGAGGVAGPGYSHADLAGVPLTGMNPLSPYLNVDPRYLIQVRPPRLLSCSSKKTNGLFPLLFYLLGGWTISRAAFGALNGLRLGLKETQNMAWSKPRNVQVLNMVTRQGALWANTLGSLALLYSAFGVIIEKTRGAEDDLNTVAAGTMTGMLYKSTGGLRGVARGGIAGLMLTGLYSLYNNWEHMRGSMQRQSL
ncbi:mitochondrial import inner membrane translocase subunit Tim23 [Protobothrops mucrosquamatus]|uniref:mitochondrial import inner membrane translocase subunit Tim23 n=1 Tax=Protobothrops mucrosquamatus TaxID=103944 RepID=UPI000775F2DE|nr:mitochondrial import inner membrane translocase subunit Tim23 [Protobothrops mucrosquamatus]